MAGLDKMFGALDREKKWKKDHSQHISQYNREYFQANKEEILTRRKIQRLNKRNSKNDFLGF